MKEVFELFDADGSGSVDEEELAAAMFALGLADTVGASGRSDGVRGGRRAAAQQMMAHVDSDGSRTVDLAEFTALMQAPSCSLMHARYSCKRQGCKLVLHPASSWTLRSPWRCCWHRPADSESDACSLSGEGHRLRARRRMERNRRGKRAPARQGLPRPC
jgi:hypothetical protein